jgi:cysteinyl-tRNA synthetase
MNDIFLYNTASRKKEKFVPLKSGGVGVYSCGPTVYWNQHIGHMYAYVQWDTLVRFLRFSGFSVKWVMNITDVGHMTSDEDAGEDKMEKGAKREGVSVWEVADKYIAQFLESVEAVSIKKPDILCRATEHIAEQIDLIKKIESNGFTYKTRMGVVFDTSKFPDYSKFANLRLDKLKASSDLAEDAEKKHSWDFLLWVTGRPEHLMQWDSPWGKGYPGWHIECTAMSTKYLGERFDIHTGGIEHIAVHHTNEIAQGYGAFGYQTANFWLHNAWLTSEGGEKMSKSSGNFVTVQELVAKGYDPIALRYLYLTSHYRKGLNFSWDALKGAEGALQNLREIIMAARQSHRTSLSQEKLEKVRGYSDKFVAALSDDLNTPQAIAILWEAMKSNVPSEDKYDLAVIFDEVLGLRLAQVSSIQYSVTSEIQELIDKRESLRKEGKFKEADEVRKVVQEKGFLIEDTPQGTRVKKAVSGRK